MEDQDFALWNCPECLTADPNHQTIVFTPVEKRLQVACEAQLAGSSTTDVATSRCAIAFSNGMIRDVIICMDEGKDRYLQASSAESQLCRRWISLRLYLTEPERESSTPLSTMILKRVLLAHLSCRSA